MRSLPGFDTSSKLETHSVGSLTGAMMSSLTISRSSCFSLSLSATGTHRGACTTGLTSLSISMWYWPGNFPSPWKTSAYLCCMSVASKHGIFIACFASSLFMLEAFGESSNGRMESTSIHLIAPMPRHAWRLSRVAQQWLILFTAHHFEVQIVFTTISVYLKCCDRHHFNFLPTIHSQCV